MTTDGYRLGVDFGTSNTVAALAGPDGRVRPLLFDGSPLLASAVFADTGPDDGTVWLGEREHRVDTLIAAVLARVVAEAARVVGGTPDTVVPEASHLEAVVAELWISR